MKTTLFTLALLISFLPATVSSQSATVIAEGVLEKVEELPPPSWQEVTEEALQQAVIKVGKKMLMERGAEWQWLLEEKLAGMASSFVIGYRVLSRYDHPEERVVRIEARVDQKALREYLRKVGVLREELKVLFLTISGLEDYGQFEAVERCLKGHEEVEKAVLWEVERGRFTWRVELAGKGRIEEVLHLLPLRLLKREEGWVEMEWLKGGMRDEEATGPQGFPHPRGSLGSLRSGCDPDGPHLSPAGPDADRLWRQDRRSGGLRGDHRPAGDGQVAQGLP